MLNTFGLLHIVIVNTLYLYRLGLGLRLGNISHDFSHEEPTNNFLLFPLQEAVQCLFKRRFVIG